MKCVEILRVYIIKHIFYCKLTHYYQVNDFYLKLKTSSFLRLS